MSTLQSNWIFNLIVRLAVVVFLGTLALGLIVGVEPVTALTRSGVAFIAFIILAHAAATIWALLVPEEAVAVQSEESSEAAQESVPPTDEAATAPMSFATGDEGLS
jgi:hypothetical protein